MHEQEATMRTFKLPGVEIVPTATGNGTKSTTMVATYEDDGQTLISLKPDLTTQGYLEGAPQPDGNFGG